MLTDILIYLLGAIASGLIGWLVTMLLRPHDNKTSVKAFVIIAAAALCFVIFVVALQPRPTTSVAGKTVTEGSGSSTPKLESALVSYRAAVGSDESFGLPVAREIRATVNGEEYVVVSETHSEDLPHCFEIFEQADFDGNGARDALITRINVCGGTALPNSYFFVSYMGDGHFAISDVFGLSLADPIIERWNDRWSVLITSTNEGMNTDNPSEIKQRFVLDAGKAVPVEESERKQIVAQAELRSSEFRADGEQKVLMYDIDQDGVEDKITATLWERWGRMLWSIEFSSGGTFQSNAPCKRIGVLATVTGGRHRIVCDQDTIFEWFGKGYAQAPGGLE